MKNEKVLTLSSVRGTLTNKWAN